MFKMEEIKELIQLIDESQTIEEFVYKTADGKIKVKRESADKKVETIVVPQETVNVASTQTTTPAPVQKEIVEEQVTTNDYYEIVSPMVGTFYAAPSPEDSPYVQVGDTVQPTTVVCIVEAMKLFNEIEAEVSGEIVEVLVEDGQLVEYGQPLFYVKER